MRKKPAERLQEYHQMRAEKGMAEMGKPRRLTGEELVQFIERARNPKTAKATGETLARSGLSRANAEKTVISVFLARGVPLETARELANQRLGYYDELTGNKKGNK